MSWNAVGLIGRKLLQLVAVLLAVTFFSFCLIKGLGHDPANSIIPFGSQQQKAQLDKDLGLDEPFLAQYGKWLGNLATGDFGKYYSTNQPVREQLNKALPVSLQLILYSQVLALVIAIPLGILTAYRAGTKLDGAVNTAAFGLLALPSFVLAFLLAIYVGARWRWLPTQGYVPFGQDPVQHFKDMALPVISLAAGQIAIYMRLLRSDMIATLQEDFITTAKAKGIPTRRVLFRHALRPSSLTLLTVAGLNVGTLIGGAVVIEVIFGLPGIGDRITKAIFKNEYVALQSYIAVIAVAYVLINFAVDLLYTVLDPRIRHGRAVA
jgi:peptide/nickel transport system permease protein